MAMVVEAAMRAEMAAQEGDDRRDAEQADTFDRLYNRVKDLLKRFGRPNFLSSQRYGDYSVHGDYAACPRLVVFITSSKMLMPPVIHALQVLLTEFSRMADRSKGCGVGASERLAGNEPIYSGKWSN